MLQRLDLQKMIWQMLKRQELLNKQRPRLLLPRRMLKLKLKLKRKNSKQRLKQVKLMLLRKPLLKKLLEKPQLRLLNLKSLLLR
jgi:hypothetical protein